VPLGGFYHVVGNLFPKSMYSGSNVLIYVIFKKKSDPVQQYLHNYLCADHWSALQQPYELGWTKGVEVVETKQRQNGFF
jgi:hypothetical protein